jgi:hypothetical protein
VASRRLRRCGCGVVAGDGGRGGEANATVRRGRGQRARLGRRARRGRGLAGRGECAGRGVAQLVEMGAVVSSRLSRRAVIAVVAPAPTTAPVATSATGGVSPVDDGADQILAAFLLIYYIFSLSQQLSLLTSFSLSLFLSPLFLCLSPFPLPLSAFLSHSLSLSLSLSLSSCVYVSFFSPNLSLSPLSSPPLLLSFLSLSGEGKERGREKESERE